MSKPNLSISVQPIQNSKATYLPLTGPTANDHPKVRSCSADIKNNGASSVTITGIHTPFLGRRLRR